MVLEVLSNDAALIKMCAEILRELPEAARWTLSKITTQSPEHSHPDLYLLDFSIGSRPPEKVNGSNVVVIAHRRDVADVRSILGFDAPVVLRPPTKATLSAFLSLAISNHELRHDRDHMFQSLLEANLKLQEYDQNRTNFLSRVVHDFRAPLTALSGYCGLLLSGPMGPLNGVQTEVVRRMHYSAKRLARMASGMVQLSVDRERQRCPDLRKGDIRQHLDQALHEIRPFSEDKKIAIKSELEACETALYFDPAQIDQVLVNILDNACKFTPRNGWIEIRGYPFFWERRRGGPSAFAPAERRVSNMKQANSYRLDIRNSGSALPREYLEKIFEEYTSYSGGNDRSGGGLGLAICRMIIDQHYGRVWAENTDGGPMFSFVLPIRRFATVPPLDSSTGTKNWSQTA